MRVVKKIVIVFFTFGSTVAESYKTLGTSKYPLVAARYIWRHWWCLAASCILYICRRLRTYAVLPPTYLGHFPINGPTLSVTIFLRNSKLVIWNVFVHFFLWKWHVIKTVLKFETELYYILWIRQAFFFLVKI